MFRTADDIPFVFGCKELAEIMGVSKSTARRIMHDDGFPVHRISEKSHRIYKDQFLRWMNGERFNCESAKSAVLNR
ncbi:helix-turn-helix domain-containing protein [Alicyclobacillus fastidiosus]